MIFNVKAATAADAQLVAHWAVWCAREAVACAAVKHPTDAALARAAVEFCETGLVDEIHEAMRVRRVEAPVHRAARAAVRAAAAAWAARVLSAVGGREEDAVAAAALTARYAAAAATGLVEVVRADRTEPLPEALEGLFKQMFSAAHALGADSLVVDLRIQGGAACSR